MGDRLELYRRVIIGHGFENHFEMSHGMIRWAVKDNVQITLHMKVKEYMGDTSIVAAWTVSRLGRPEQYGMHASGLDACLKDKPDSLLTKDLEASIQKAFRTALGILADGDDSIVATSIGEKCTVVIALPGMVDELNRMLAADDGTWLNRA